MSLDSAEENKSPILSQRLLLSVAEELKLPLIQIARLAEQSKNDLATGKDNLQVIEATADSATRLLDSYILGVRLKLDPQALDLESVSVSSVLYDASQQLFNLAKSYGVDMELNIAGRFGPVLANRQGLEAALTCLGAALIEALPALEESKLRLQLATHRSRYGVVAGIYTDVKQLSTEALQTGRRLYTSTRQPLINFSHTNGAGVFVADSILKAMNLNLVASRHHRLYGLGTVMQPNHQLQLVT